MKKLLLLPALFISTCIFAQSDTTHATKTKAVIDENAPYTIVEEMPEFPGGDPAMMDYIRNNIKYPKAEKKKGISGTTYVTFVVERDGSLSNVRTLRGVPKGEALDQEAVRVVESMPRWKPGMQGGKTVRTQFNLPIKYTLR